MEERSRWPKHLRQPTYWIELGEAVLTLRKEYPHWGKDKLVILLREEGCQASTSMVGRIIHRLKERGTLREPIRNRARWGEEWHFPNEFIRPFDGQVIECFDNITRGISSPDEQALYCWDFVANEVDYPLL